MPVSSSVWDLIHPTNNAPTGKASHASIAIDDVVWSIGGEFFDGSSDPNNIDVYNVTSRIWSKVEVSGDMPKPRFDHTVVKYKVCTFYFETSLPIFLNSEQAVHVRRSYKNPSPSPNDTSRNKRALDL